MTDPRLARVRGISALGDALGYYRELAVGGLTPAELAARTTSCERFAREWLARQAHRGHIDYEPQSGRYSLNDRQRASIWDWNRDPPSPSGYSARCCHSGVTVRAQGLRIRRSQKGESP